MVWHRSIDASLFDFLATASALKPRATDEEQNSQATVNPKSSEVQIEDCFGEFKQVETLDEDNKWYCNKCKDFVNANKTLEIYTVPKIMIISLKRFKVGRSKYGFGGGQKLDTLVEFPLEGLDMSPYIMSNQQLRSGDLIYDCFGVSNHFGSSGFGHYTAFAKHPISGEWYNYDDANVTKVSSGLRQNQIVSSAAYNLFFRRRENKNMEDIDFDTIEQKPDHQFL